MHFHPLYQLLPTEISEIHLCTIFISYFKYNNCALPFLAFSVYSFYSIINALVIVFWNILKRKILYSCSSHHCIISINSLLSWMGVSLSFSIFRTWLRLKSDASKEEGLTAKLITSRWVNNSIYWMLTSWKTLLGTLQPSFHLILTAPLIGFVVSCLCSAFAPLFLL